MIRIFCKGCGGELELESNQLASDIDIQIKPCGCRDFRHLNDDIENAQEELKKATDKLDKLSSIISGT